MVLQGQRRQGKPREKDSGGWGVRAKDIQKPRGKCEGWRHSRENPIHEEWSLKRKSLRWFRKLEANRK